MTKLLLSKPLRRRIARSPLLQRVAWSLEAGILGLFWRLSAALPPETASNMGRRMLAWLGPRLHKSAPMRRNLSLAFPDLDADARERLLRAVWGNTGACLAEFPHFKRLCEGDFERYFEVACAQELQDCRDGRRPIVFVAPHLANWELQAAVPARFGVPLAAVYSKLSNPLIDRKVRRWRQALGCGLISRDAGARPLMKALSEGASLGIICDHRDDAGVPLSFFGHDKLTTLMPARLALRYGADLVPVRVERKGPARFRFSTAAPIKPDPGLATDKDRAIDMMRQVNQVFEAWIRARPEQWLCTKRAWPKELAPALPQGAEAGPAGHGVAVGRGV